MTWVIKAGRNDDTENPPEYLHQWAIGVHGTPVRADSVQWDTCQGLAHRFDDRNVAVRIATAFGVGSYDETVRVVKLRPKSPVRAVEVKGVANPNRKHEGDRECG